MWAAPAIEVEVDPNALNICHCTDCQTLSGSAFRVNIPAPAEHFVLLSGTPKSYVKTAESGNKRLHAFCGNCGTPIYACAVDNPQSYGLRLGASTSARPSHRTDKVGGGLRCIGWMRSLPVQRDDKLGTIQIGPSKIGTIKYSLLIIFQATVSMRSESSALNLFQLFAVHSNKSFRKDLGRMSWTPKRSIRISRQK